MSRLAAALLAGLPLAVPAAEDAIELKSGPGRELVQTRCVMCHSLDYIPMNSPFLDRKGWEGSVNKMIRVMGAPVPDEEVPLIVEYLSTHYGR